MASVERNQKFETDLKGNRFDVCSPNKSMVLFRRRKNRYSGENELLVSWFLKTLKIASWGIVAFIVARVDQEKRLFTKQKAWIHASCWIKALNCYRRKTFCLLCLLSTIFCSCNKSSDFLFTILSSPLCITTNSATISFTVTYFPFGHRSFKTFATSICLC